MNILYFVLIIALVFFDQLTKHIAITYLKKSDSPFMLNNTIYLRLVKNTGAAFSTFRNKNRILVILIIPVILLLLYYFNLLLLEEGMILIKIAMAFTIGGGIGNLIDRIRLGYVVDFIYFPIKKCPVFNFADIFIFTGTLIMFYSVL